MSLQFFWRAVYSDDTELLQLNPDGSENLYRDIDRSKLVRFDLIDFETGYPEVVVHLRPEQRLIVRRRTFKMVNSPEPVIVWLVGWQETRSDVNFQVINMVFPDGHVEIVDRFMGDDALYGQINLMDVEKKSVNPPG